MCFSFQLRKNGNMTIIPLTGQTFFQFCFHKPNYPVYSTVTISFTGFLIETHAGKRLHTQGDDHDRLLPSGNYNRDFTRPDRNYNPINSLIPVPLQPNKYVRPLSPHRYLHGSSYPGSVPSQPLYRYKMTIYTGAPANHYRS